MARSRHTSKDIERAIRAAEAAGWTVVKGRSHAWGVLRCPHGQRDGCKMSVWSTPRDPFAHAADILRLVRDCPHQTPS